MKRLIQKGRRRDKRKLRIRGKVSGTTARPRVSIFRSNRHLYAQAIDDTTGATICSVSSVAGDLKGLKPTTTDAARIGEALGKDLVDRKFSEVVFDRNGYLYHGVVKALADGIRKAGLKL